MWEDRQVVTLTEMMGTFLNLVGAARTLLIAIALVAVVISTLSVFNTMMAAVLERTGCTFCSEMVFEV